jgi:hypothetical protein
VAQALAFDDLDAVIDARKGGYDDAIHGGTLRYRNRESLTFAGTVEIERKTSPPSAFIATCRLVDARLDLDQNGE